MVIVGSRRSLPRQLPRNVQPRDRRVSRVTIVVAAAAGAAMVAVVGGVNSFLVGRSTVAFELQARSRRPAVVPLHAIAVSGTYTNVDDLLSCKDEHGDGDDRGTIEGPDGLPVLHRCRSSVRLSEEPGGPKDGNIVDQGDMFVVTEWRRVSTRLLLPMRGVQRRYFLKVSGASNGWVPADATEALAVAADEEEATLISRADLDATSDGGPRLLNTHSVFCAPSAIHGWGVYAAKDFVASEVLHEAPGRLLPGIPEEFQDDIFEAKGIGVEGNFTILGLGFASLHNHDDTPNCAVMWEKPKRHGSQIVGTFYTLKPVKKGEELLISYGDEWFSNRSTTPA